MPEPIFYTLAIGRFITLKGLTMQTIFGTDGIRGKFGITPLSPLDLIQLGNALAHWTQKSLSTSPRILIGHDTRESASLMKAALKTGLLQHATTLFDAGVIPTPALFYLVTKTNEYDFGIMLTASHNPYQDNGIKIFSKKNGKLSVTEEAEITKLFYEAPSHQAMNQLGTDTPSPLALDIYYNALKKMFPKHFLRGLSLAIDCAHGAYAQTAPAFLESLGANLISLATEPNGKNINDQCGSLHPETIQQVTLDHSVNASFAFDGDGDRICALTESGTIMDGDDLVGFLMHHPQYEKNSAIVGTIMSNQGLESFVTDQKKTFYRTPVGDKRVLEKMKELGSTIGGEPSGHIILKDFSETADALFVLLRIIETALLTKNWSLHAFSKFPQILINTPVACKKDLSQKPYVDIIAAQETSLCNGRLVVRYSGTESLLRVMVEATTEEQALSVGTVLSEQLAQALK